MSTLQSQLFTQADPAVVQRLERCANGYPNEVVSHFVIGQSGEHVRLTQVALATIAERSPELEVPLFNTNAVYDQAFADAVSQYKRARKILNFAGAIDNIIGRKTIASLDRDLVTLQEPYPPPPEPVPPDPVPPSSCVVAAECPRSQTFTLRLLGGLTGGEILEVGAFLFDVHDFYNNLSARYFGRVIGLGVPSPIPVSPSLLGQPTSFTTRAPCRVTDFFAFAISSVTLPPPYPLSASPVTLSHQTASGANQTLPFLLDSGAINLPGASIHGGTLELMTTCNDQPGARRGD